MAEPIHVRKALKKDCPRLLELIKELAEYEKEPQAVTVTLREMEDAGFGPKKVWQALVAEKEGIIVGFALWYVRYSTWKGRMIYLEDFIVTRPERRSGIGDLLFDELEQECRRNSYYGITWQVLDWNKPAQEFYKKRGARFSTEWWNGTWTPLA